MTEACKTGYENVKRWLGDNPVQRAFTQLHGYFTSGNAAERQRRREILVALLKRLLAPNGVPSASAQAEVRRILERLYPPGEVEKLLGYFQTAGPVSAEEAAAVFAGLDEERRANLLQTLLRLAVDSDTVEGNRDWLDDLALRLGVSPEEVELLLEKFTEERKKRRHIFRSGAGVLAVLVIIGVFILTATLLKSVIFGLIGAYILLPLEQFFERKLRSRRGIIHAFAQGMRSLGAPLRYLRTKCRRNAPAELPPEERKAAEQRAVTAQAVSLTVATLLAMVLAAGLLVGVLGSSYIADVRESITGWARQEQGAEIDANDSTFERITHRFRAFLEEKRTSLEKVPLVRTAVDSVSAALTDPATQKDLLNQALRRTGGIFSLGARTIGFICQLLLNVLLTVFFFLLFLTKLADFCRGNATTERQSAYLVRTVFSGSWLPLSNEGTLLEAQRIISDIIQKLRIWVRGYLTLLCIDLVVYTSVYFFLGIPYFYILGPIAACGVLLPVFGPLAGSALALVVTLAVGGASATGVQLLGIVLLYCVQNLLIEQFILYPVVFGGALGLSTLETIIVVLLGGIFGGITGMIIAIPTAAILKYLVPQIYRIWGGRPASLPEGGSS